MNGNKRKIINIGWGSERDIERDRDGGKDRDTRERKSDRGTYKQRRKERERERKYLAFDFPPCGIVVVQAN